MIEVDVRFDYTGDGCHCQNCNPGPHHCLVITHRLGLVFITLGKEFVTFSDPLGVEMDRCCYCGRFFVHGPGSYNAEVCDDCYQKGLSDFMSGIKPIPRGGM